MKTKNYKKNGFTIIELLIVIGLLVIIFSTVFAIQGRFLVNTYLDTNTEQIVQQLRLAQMRSITKFEDSEWGVYFAEDKFVLFKGADYESRDQSYDIVTNLPSSLILSSFDFNGDTDYIVFDKVSGETQNHGSLQIFDNQEGVNTILINKKGLTGVNEMPPESGSGDTTNPSSVNDLKTSNATEESIDLSWTATGDDGDIGTANSYDIRYSVSTITEKNWDLAEKISGEPIPSPSGSPESLTVSGLLPATTYYFAMKVLDEVPNESDLSNVASLTTLKPVTTQAEFLVVNTEKAFFDKKYKNLQGITISNNGKEDIVIDKIIVKWNGIKYSFTYLRNIKINSGTVWSGYGYSGWPVDIKDFKLAPTQVSYPINQFGFNKSMKGSTISITFIMTDKSTLTTPKLKF